MRGDARRSWQESCTVPGRADARCRASPVRKSGMTLRLLLLAAIVSAPPLLAQAPAPSPADTPVSPAEDAVPTRLPVSVDRIREALAAPPPQILRGISERPTFAIAVEERLRLEDFFTPEDFEVGPVPPGGLYAYEMQRVTRNPVSHPLGQPYAAFSGGELTTLAIQAVITRLLGQRLVQGFADSQAAAAQAAAEAEVALAINEYCAAQPDRGAWIELCRNRARSR